MVSTVIISVVALALLSLKGNHSYIFAKSYDKKEAIEILNIASLNSKVDDTDISSDLYENLREYIELEDDDLVKFFKDKEYQYKQEESSIIDFLEVDSDIDSEEEFYQGEEETEENPFIIEIRKEEVYTDKAGAYLYRIRLLQ